MFDILIIALACACALIVPMGILEGVWMLITGEWRPAWPSGAHRQKIPRKAATKRGMVGERIKRPNYGYITIIPQPTLDVKRIRTIRSRARYER